MSLSAALNAAISGLRVNQASVQCACLCSAGTQGCDRLAAGGQATLRLAKALLGLALLVLEATDRRFRLDAPCIERGALLLGAATFERNDLGLPREPGDILAAARDLRRVTHDVLLEPMLFGGQRGDR